MCRSVASASARSPRPNPSIGPGPDRRAAKTERTDRTHGADVAGRWARITCRAQANRFARHSLRTARIECLLPQDISWRPYIDRDGNIRRSNNFRGVSTREDGDGSLRAQDRCLLQFVGPLNDTASLGGKPMSVRLEHANLFVRDIDATIRFCKRHFPNSECGSMAWIRVAFAGCISEQTTLT